MRRPQLRLLLVLVFEGAALEVLRRIGAWLPVEWDDPLAWLPSAPVEDAVAVAAWAAALGVVLWLALTTVAYLGTRIARLPRASALVRRATVPMVHRLVDRALVLSLVTSIAACPAVAAEPPPPVVFLLTDDAEPPTAAASEASGDDRVITVLPPGVLSVGYASRPLPDPEAETDLEVDVPPPSAPAPSVTGGRHTVEPGDNLWTIAAAHLSVDGVATPAPDEVAGYWRQVVAANRATLRSGDPNLIYPGEIVTLPNIEQPS